MIIRRTSTIFLMLLIATPFSTLTNDIKTKITQLLLTHPFPCNPDRQKGEPTLTVYPNNLPDHHDMKQEVKFSIEAIEDLFANNQKLSDLRSGNTYFGLMIDAYLSRLNCVLYELNQQTTKIDSDAPSQNQSPKKTTTAIKRDALATFKSVLESLNIDYQARETEFVTTCMQSIQSTVEKLDRNKDLKDRFDNLDPLAQAAIFARNHARLQNDRCQTLLTLSSKKPDFTFPSEEQIKAAFENKEDYQDYQTIRSFIDQTGVLTTTLGIFEQPVNTLLTSNRATDEESRTMLGEFLHLDTEHRESFLRALKKA